MKKNLMLVLLWVVAEVGYSQVVSQQNAYRCSDRLAEKQIGLPQQKGSGSNMLWDICGQSLPDHNYIVEYGYAPDTTEAVVGVTEQDSRYFYELQGDSLLLNGFENRLTKMEYDVREAYLRFPMVYGDSIEGFFHGKGRYCDRLGLRSFGYFKTKADEMGDLVVAEGDTLHQVLRLHTERIMATEQMPIEMLDSLPVYTPDSIIDNLVNNISLIRMDICRWYVEGYRYPIIESRMRYDGDSEQPVSAKIYYCPPQEQAMLTNDPENEQVRTRGSAESGHNYPQAKEMSQEPATTILYGIDGREDTHQTHRKGVYIEEQHRGSTKTARKITVKK